MSFWRPSTTGVLIGGVVVVVVAAAIAFMVTHFQPRSEVRVGSGIFNLQLATDEPARVQGLSGVDHLNPNGGLLMVFDTDSTWEIWMKDMKIPLDILWLNSDKKVIYVVKNASPQLSTNKVFKPTDKARYVIELNAGAIEQNNIKIGETALFTAPGESS